MLVGRRLFEEKSKTCSHCVDPSLPHSKGADERVVAVRASAYAVVRVLVRFGKALREPWKDREWGSSERRGSVYEEHANRQEAMVGEKGSERETGELS
eukprot:3616383-Pleurochrysis_carterae.AAC.1